MPLPHRRHDLAARRPGQRTGPADRASAHTAARTQMLAAALGIRFLWLPKQAPELNAMDQLWRELKRLIAANRQAASWMLWPATPQTGCWA